MKDNQRLPARHYYRLSQAAIELDCPPDYLIHIASLGKVKLITHPSKMLCYRVRVIHWGNGQLQSTTVLDWTMMSAEFVVLVAPALRLLERDGELEVDSITDEWPKGSTMLRELLHRSNSWPPQTENSTVMIDASLPSRHDDDGWEPPPHGEGTGLTITPEDLWVPGEEVERLKRGEPAEPTKEVPPEIAAQIYRDPAPKSRNFYLRTIAALGQALLGKELTQPHKDAYAILQAIGAAGIEPPVKEDALANYLKAAGEVEKKPRG